jgi:15-cis-phytoene synthase
MFTQIDNIDPSKTLALTYAKDELRHTLTILLALDRRLGQIAAKSTEPLIGQMRMAWWRDALLKPSDQRPKGEPLFQDLASLGHDISGGMINIVDAWAGLLAHELWTHGVLAAFANDRSAGIFGTMARSAHVDAHTQHKLLLMGQRWALLDAIQYCKTAEEAQSMQSRVPPRAPNYRVPRTVRALSMLALAAEQTRGGMGPGIRLMWHGLTGR